ncbi:MAG: hypothetical protein FD124_1626 [Alphaproteobacteria bacterium]|nr:MAG: hypothetical protein FD160_1514 [Caulobacteraceae bacterium]TPW06626.1 MAG: hypothetical protein FD124_1626 [Alphaproteobacteria bacterium]
MSKVASTMPDNVFVGITGGIAIDCAITTPPVPHTPARLRGPMSETFARHQRLKTRDRLAESVQR